MESQAGLRREVLKKRRELSPSEVKARSAQLSLLLKDLVESQRPARLATYISVQNEVEADLSFFEGEVCYPRVEGSHMEFYVSACSPSEFVPNPWGIKEPPLEKSQNVHLGAQDVVLVPGVVFNRKGDRIGMGKGYYDRYLSQCPAQRWGLAYHFQVVDQEWETQEWDQKVDRILTERFALELVENRRKE